MPKFKRADRTKWVRKAPDPGRDARKLVKQFWSLQAASEERAKRIQILSKGHEHSRVLADTLARTKLNQPARVFCCPVVARSFQLFFVDRGLAVDTSQRAESTRITLIDDEHAVPFGKARTVDWRRLHDRLRKRLRRILGRRTVAMGVGELEADYQRRVWQPHHHLVIYGASERRLKALRKKVYVATSEVPRPMVVSRRGDLAGWLSYISKLMAFRKLPRNGQNNREIKGRRTRLKVKQFREFMRYLAHHRPTSFIFAMNCSIAKVTA